MRKASRSPGLFKRLVARPTPAGYDAADMGTAFGLEISLDQPEEAMAAPASAPGRAPAWVRRLLGRGKPTP
jgi:hypothetical protein